MIVDIACEEADFLGGKAHKGMMEGALEILEYIKETLKSALENNPGYKLFITGHSLGGGVGTLLAMAIRAGLIKDCVPADVAMICKLLAPPPVFFSQVSLAKKSNTVFILYYLFLD